MSIDADGGAETPQPEEQRLDFAFGAKDGLVYWQFSQPVAYFGMTPGDAKQVAAELIRYANQIEAAKPSIIVPRRLDA